MLNRIIKYFLENRIITAFLLLAVILGGLATAPFNWHNGLLPRDPIAIDAITDLKTDNNGKNALYDLQGRQVKTARKGIYVTNGKKAVF